jgi:hypothetical protein
MVCFNGNLSSEPPDRVEGQGEGAEGGVAVQGRDRAGGKAGCGRAGGTNSEDAKGET